MDDGDPGGPDADDGRGRREVVVPIELYKTVTVFSTLFAIVLVVGGFLLFDAAIQTGNPFRRGLAWLLGVDRTATVLSALFGGGGLVSIAAGVTVYVLGTRFRTAEMGKSKDETDEVSDDG